VREDLHEESIADKPSAPPPATDSFPQAATPSPDQDLESRPRMFDERGYQVSADRQFWWNGGTWVPGQPPGSEPFSTFGQSSASGSPGVTAVQAVIAIGGLILFAGFAFSVCQSMPGSTFPTP